MPDCGAVVQFSGTARDHSTDRPGVDLLQYEAYENQVEPRLDAIVAEMRRRWNDLGRVALLHRVGPVAVGDPAVVVAVSSPHRDAAFEAARFAIDTLKTTVPIWKRERWQGGESWGLEAQHIIEAAAESAVPETPVPETPVPETPVPETPVPETPVPETRVPETRVPEAAR